MPGEDWWVASKSAQEQGQRRKYVNTRDVETIEGVRHVAGISTNDGNAMHMSNNNVQIQIRAL